jgi:hypothetical protein
MMTLGTELTSSTELESHSDRRGTLRFPLQEELTYKVLHSKAPVSGAGKTLNIASGGILFTTQDRLPVGRMVELAINWPVRLDGTCALRFVAVGRVIRADADRAVARIERYEFRTRGNGGAPRAVPTRLQ